MDLLVNRTTKSENSTIGEFSVNGQFFSYCLEPIDRGLTKYMSLEEIQRIKVKNKTCIPTGKYQISKYFSPKHNDWVPILLHVPGFDYVEIHIGNFPKDTDACLLLGTDKGTDQILNSKIAINKFYPLFFETLKKEEQVWITYQ